MKVKFRTVLLVFLFIKLCILFTVLQEAIESLNSNDHPLLFGTDDIYFFDVMLTSVSGLSMLISAFLIILFAIGHNRIRKPYLVLAFVLNLIFVVPFFLSGIYLTSQDDHGLQLTSKIRGSFESLLDFAEKYNANSTNTTIMASNKTKVKKPKLQKLPDVDTAMLKRFKIVEHIQRRYCCCGLIGADDYGFTNATTASRDTIPFTSALDISCPHNSLFKDSKCGDTHNKGCEKRLKNVYPTRILIYSCVGTSFSVIFALLSPLIYSQFELDRRRARAKYIRDWRHDLETHINDHRMWARRKEINSPETKRDVNQSPVSPALSSAPTQSSKSKESLKKGETSN